MTLFFSSCSFYLCFLSDHEKKKKMSALHYDVEGCSFHVVLGVLFAFSDVILRFCFNISFGEVV